LKYEEIELLQVGNDLLGEL